MTDRTDDRTAGPDPGPVQPAAEAADRPTTLFRAAQVLTMASGLTMATYALLAFNQPDWTVAGPSLLVAAGGAIAGRWRWGLLAALLPLVAIFTVAGQIIAFDLNRPDEVAYFAGSALGLCTSIPAAVLAVAALAQPHAGRRATLAYGALSIVATVAVGAVVLGQETASRNRGTELTAAERAAAVQVDLMDYAFIEDRIEISDDGTVVHLVNTGTLPHNLFVPSLGLTVLVPSGRDAYVEIPASAADQSVWCTVGDHRRLGMTATLVPA